jgi:hypothetical protein
LTFQGSERSDDLRCFVRPIAPSDVDLSEDACFDESLDRFIRWIERAT